MPLYCFHFDGRPRIDARQYTHIQHGLQLIIYGGAARVTPADALTQPQQPRAHWTPPSFRRALAR